MTSVRPFHIRTQQKESLAIKSYVILTRHRKCKTDHSDSDIFQTSSNCSSSKKLLALPDKSPDFPSIFGHRKRAQYSGYKQCNLNKSKLIKLEEDNAESSLRKPTRKYQANIKNIAKLRKRYSLEPNYIKANFKQSNKVYKSTIFNFKQDNTTDCNSPPSNHQNKLRQLMKNIILQHNSERRRSLIDLHDQEPSIIPQKNDPQIARELQNQTCFHRYNCSTDRTEHPQHQQESQNNSKPACLSRPYYLRIKKRVEKKISQKMQIKQNIQQSSRSFVFQDKDQDSNELCGWQSHTFYHPKGKAKFFNNLSIRQRVK